MSGAQAGGTRNMIRRSSRIALRSIRATAPRTLPLAYHPAPAQRLPNTAGFVFTACQPKK